MNTFSLLSQKNIKNFMAHNLRDLDKLLTLILQEVKIKKFRNLFLVIDNFSAICYDMQYLDYFFELL